MRSIKKRKACDDCPALTPLGGSAAQINARIEASSTTHETFARVILSAIGPLRFLKDLAVLCASYLPRTVPTAYLKQLTSGCNNYSFEGMGRIQSPWEIIDSGNVFYARMKDCDMGAKELTIIAYSTYYEYCRQTLVIAGFWLGEYGRSCRINPVGAGPWPQAPDEEYTEDPIEVPKDFEQFARFPVSEFPLSLPE